MSETRENKLVFPFPAIVGQEKAKLALLIAAVNPAVGGVLLRGDKGTGKSTMVRAFADVLPEVKVVADCPFRCDPDDPRYMCDRCYERYRRGEPLPVAYRKMRVVDLPLSITIERLVGTIDVEKFLREGVVEFKPGLLAEANRNILYIDEVNLLDDYIIDTLLDVAASGWNIVEREGISIKHPARFILVGSMNPEEGELRPQILDRFGLVVDVEAPMDPEVRAEIVRRVEEWQRDPESFYRKYLPEIQQLRERIARARELLPHVEIDDDLLKLVTKTIVELGIKTSRAEITTVRAAKAIAALDGRRRVTLEDVKRAMELTLPHRLKARPFQQSSGNPFRNSAEETKQSLARAGSPTVNSAGKSTDRLGQVLNESSRRDTTSREHVVSEVLIPPSRQDVLGYLLCRESLRADLQSSSQRRARAVRARVRGVDLPGVRLYALPVRDIYSEHVDLYSTVVTHVILTRRGPPITLYSIRTCVKSCRAPVLDILVIDASGSMNFQQRVAIAKKVVQELSERSYIERSSVALIAIQGGHAQVLVYPSRLHEHVYRTVELLRSGGSTPLPHGLLLALELAKQWMRKTRRGKVRVHLITDGKANVPLWSDPVEDSLKLIEELYKLGAEILIYDARPRSVFDPSRTIFDTSLPHFVKIVHVG